MKRRRKNKVKKEENMIFTILLQRYGSIFLSRTYRPDWWTNSFWRFGKKIILIKAFEHWYSIFLVERRKAVVGCFILSLHKTKFTLRISTNKICPAAEGSPCVQFQKDFWSGVSIGDSELKRRPIEIFHHDWRSLSSSCLDD